MKNVVCTTMIILSLVLMPIPAGSQVATGGSFTLEQAVIAGGGGQGSTGSSGGTTFTLDGTIGQSVAGGPATGGTFGLTSGFWNFTANSSAGQGLEGDVASRPNGDNSIDATDVIGVQLFDIGSNLPFQSNEFQRADSAPFATLGDGAIDATDVIQAQRYDIMADPLTTAGGAIAPAPISAPLSVAKESAAITPVNGCDVPAGERAVCAEDASAGRGQTVTVNIRVDAVGNESAYSVDLSYDQTVFPTIPTTSNGTVGAPRSCNAMTPGIVRCSVTGFLNDQPGSSNDQIGEILPGPNQILLRVNFMVGPTAPVGATSLTLSGVVASNDLAQSLPIAGLNGTFTVSSPTAASVSVSGRLLTADGAGVTNATVTLSDSFGSTRSVLSGPFGYFTFEGIAAGQTYVVSVGSKRYSFTPQVVTVVDDVTGLVFIADR